MSEYKIIMFDLDGTLTDPGEGITNSVAYSLNKFGISVKERSELYKFIGPPLIYSFETFYGFSSQEAKKAVEYYREYYSDKGIWESFVYSGVEDMLKELKKSGKCICLATSKPEFFARQILERYGLSKYFDFIAGALLDETRTKKQEVISYLLEQLKTADYAHILMVGDREHDVLGAKQFGISTIGVTFGYGSREELERAGAAYIADSAEQITEIINS